MMTTAVPDWLNYGALGLLALVLVGVGLVARDIIKRFFETVAFTQDLTSNAIRTMTELVKANQVVMQESSRVQRELMTAMVKLNGDVLGGHKEILQELERKCPRG